jgi:cysteine synthase A
MERMINLETVYSGIEQLVGNTPLLQLNRYGAGKNLCARILAKLEGLNPAGSAKDRVGLSLILDAEERGLLKPGATIIEPTSGNTGIGLACIAAARGYHVILTMPDTMSAERRAMLSAYGAKLVLTPGAQGMQGAVDKAKELSNSIPGSFIPDQFQNPANPQAHYRTTGPEIWRDTDGHVDIFVASVGTGGTLSGTGRYLKEQNPQIKVVAVEPDASPLLSGGTAGPHKIQGIGANFIPSTLDQSVYDQVIRVRDEDAFQAGRDLVRCEGILVGISSGAALWAAEQLAQKPEHRGKTIVVVLPDSGDRYLSSDMFRTE